MVKRTFTFLLSIILLGLAAGCEEQNDGLTPDGVCITSGNIAMQVFGRKGLAYYDVHHNVFTIQTAIEGTYDGTDIGIVCNMPLEVQDEIKAASTNQKLVKVVFSGTYRELTNPAFGTPIPGYSYYTLGLSSFRIEGIFTL